MFDVEAEYTHRLTVVLGVVAGLLPWTFTYSTISDLATIVNMRFAFVQLRVVSGLPIESTHQLMTPYTAWQYQQGYSVAVPYLCWLVGALILAGAVLVSLAFYVRPAAVTARCTPSRVVGGLLAGATGWFTIGAVLLWTHGPPGLHLPLSPVFLGLFAWILWTAPVPDGEAASDTAQAGAPPDSASE